MQLFSSILQYTKDALFPIFCLGCNKEGEWVCARCLGTLDMSGVFCCPGCHAPEPHGGRCERCRDTGQLANHMAITSYQERELIGRMIHAFKYQYAEDIFQVLERLIGNFTQKNRVLCAIVDSILPVPLHPRRLAERGFNQADMIAQALARELDKPYEDCLRRTRYTPHQALLARVERLQNVKDAFTLSSGANVAGKNILLVDDVFTTGATLEECAKILKTAGARSVSGFTIARG